MLLEPLSKRLGASALGSCAEDARVETEPRPEPQLASGAAFRTSCLGRASARTGDGCLELLVGEIACLFKDSAFSAASAVAASVGSGEGRLELLVNAIASFFKDAFSAASAAENSAGAASGEGCLELLLVNAIASFLKDAFSAASADETSAGAGSGEGCLEDLRLLVSAAASF